MSSPFFLVSGPPVVGVSCPQGHFRDQRRCLSTPLFPVGLAALGAIIDFFWLLPAGDASLYFPVGTVNLLGAWLVIKGTILLRDRLTPLPSRCPVCKGPVDPFRATIDQSHGPNVIESTSTIVFIILHIVASFFI